MSIDLTIEATIASVVINRPEKMNALDIAHLRDLRHALAAASASPDVRVIVLSGAGPKAFCAGADLTAQPATSSVLEAFGADLERSAAQGLYVRLFDLDSLYLRKPVIAAIDGYCLGGGLEIALQCDVLLASESARFGLTEVAVGTIPGGGGVTRLLASVPRAAAMDLILSGRQIDAARALDIGLVSAVWPTDTFSQKAHDYAALIAGNAPLAVQMARMLARQAPGLSESAAQHLTELAWGLVRDTEDRAEGKRAFAERRRPQFKGK